MPFSLQDSIFNYLMDENYKNSLRYVPSQEIRSYLRAAYPIHSWSDKEYLKAIRTLINRRFIEEDIESYRIKTEGKIYYETNQSNNACIIYFLVLFVIMSLVILLFNSNNPLRQVPNSSFTNLPKFVSVPLTGMVDENSHPLVYGKLKDFFDRIPDSNSFDVPFELSADSAVVETGSSNSKNPWLIYLPIGEQGVRKVHLLINLSHTTSNLINAVKNQAICRVHFIAENGKEEQIQLYAGKDIRDWLIGSKDGIHTVSNPEVISWTAQQPKTKTKAAIDYLTLDVPEGMRQERIKAIMIDDRSWEILENTNPGIVIFGIILEK